jgi:glycosyltransferase involved in cell wall biosynthesis
VPLENNRLIDEFGLSNKKVVMYSGNLGRYQPLEVMIKAADEIKERKDIKFVFAGDGGKKKKIQELALSMNLENVLFIPFQPIERLAESLSMADISLMGIYPENEGVIMPSKLYGLLAIGKPIICVSDPNSEVVEILKKSGAGLHSNIDDPQELADEIVELIDNPGKAAKMGLNGRDYFLENFERKNLTKQWKKVLKKILQSTLTSAAQPDPGLICSNSAQVLRSEGKNCISYNRSSSLNIS